jgi:carbonic anhydrase
MNVEMQQQHHHMESSINAGDLHKAKKVIDSLNTQIDGLERQLMDVGRQMLKEKQKKAEESSRLHRAEQTITQMEDERAKLKVKLMQIAVVNRKSFDEDEINSMSPKESESVSLIHSHVKEEDESSSFGRYQSPINIITITPPDACDDLSGACHESVVKLNEGDFSANGLKFSYPEKVCECTIINNGHTVQVNIPSSAKCKLSIYEKEYDLKQFHFHTPSEHTIDSRKYEMEMHLVHVNEANEICVLGFIFTTAQKYEKPRLQLTKSRAHLQTNNFEADEESDDLETDDEWDDGDEERINIGNDFLNQFWDELPPHKSEKEILLGAPLSFDYLFETASKSVSKNVVTNEIEIDMDIFEYMGSLTTPPYTEGVQWLLSKTTHFINDKQLKQLSACWNNEKNARPVQKYFGRQVSLRSKSSLRVIT